MRSARSSRSIAVPALQRLDPDKPINWKRQVDATANTAASVTWALHVAALPFRAGWFPKNVGRFSPTLSRHVPTTRATGCRAASWDNATLLCEVIDPASGEPFPMMIKTQRIARARRTRGNLEVYGTRASARYSTRDPKPLEFLDYTGGEQIWARSKPATRRHFKTITGGIFEFGFTDAILQMLGRIPHELVHGKTAGAVRRLRGRRTKWRSAIASSRPRWNRSARPRSWRFSRAGLVPWKRRGIAEQALARALARPRPSGGGDSKRALDVGDGRQRQDRPDRARACVRAGVVDQRGLRHGLEQNLPWRGPITPVTRCPCFAPGWGRTNSRAGWGPSCCLKPREIQPRGANRSWRIGEHPTGIDPDQSLVEAIPRTPCASRWRAGKASWVTAIGPAHGRSTP